MMASVTAINNLGGHTHNPRGNLWFNDESTYGHKLLMKMGWNKGKGLGKNENGIKENLKVKFRNTNAGLGFKDDAYANVMKTEYESILKNLASEYSCSGATNLNKIVDNSNVKPVKTKVVKSKLRYPKLFFGKDVTKYSEKDMKSIFVCSIPLKSTEEKDENPVISDKKSLESESSQTFSSTLGISDYFAKKMEKKKNHTLDKNINSTVVCHEPPLNVEKTNQVFSEIENSDINDLTLPNKKKSKKRKKKYIITVEGTEVNSDEIEPYVSNITKKDSKSLFDNSSICAVENISSENSTMSSCETALKVEKPNKVPSEVENIDINDLALSKKKSSKEKKKKYIIVEGTEVNSDEIEPCVSNITKINTIENLCDNSNICAIENISSQNSTKSSHETALNVVKPNLVSSKIENDDINDLAFSNKKSSKKRKKKYIITVEGSKTNSNEIEPCVSNITKKDTIENLCENSNICAVENISSQNSTRKSKKRKLSQMLGNESVESSEIEFLCEIQTLSPIKKKKKKDEKCSAATQLSSEDIAHENDSISGKVHKETNEHLLESVEDGLANNTNCLKKKKKSKRKLREKLKSCLKNKRGSYSFKNVSFNETVSYRIIDSEIESVIPLASCENLNGNTSDELTTSDQNNLDDVIYLKEETASCEQNSKNDSFAEEQDCVPEESDDQCTLSHLPSSKSSHYNAWVESQRQALKMELYKKLLKGIKNHKILKTTNMLSIKGYGNWGFK